MTVHRKRAAKRHLAKRERIALTVPKRPNRVWSVDLMSDALACGRRFCTVNVIDDFNRQSLHIQVDTAINAARLVRVFEQITCDHGLLKGIRTDNGPAFLGEAFQQWSKDNGVDLQHIQAGKPNQNAFSASTGRFAKRCVISTCFQTLRRSEKQPIGG